MAVMQDALPPAWLRLASGTSSTRPTVAQLSSNSTCVGPVNEAGLRLLLKCCGHCNSGGRGIPGVSYVPSWVVPTQHSHLPSSESLLWALHGAFEAGAAPPGSSCNIPSLWGAPNYCDGVVLDNQHMLRRQAWPTAE